MANEEDYSCGRNDRSVWCGRGGVCDRSPRIDQKFVHLIWQLNRLLSRVRLNFPQSFFNKGRRAQ